MIKNQDYIFLGQFIQESNKMIIGDPCPNDNNNNLIIKNVKQGSWNSWSYHKINIAVLIAKYCPINIKNNPEASEYIETNNWKTMKEIHIDNFGQAGFFDMKYHTDDNNTNNYELDTLDGYIDTNIKGNIWYAMISKIG